ncbi:proton-coupled amino acid transporter-like protein pathetic [Anticarsia gemmatalis]|uniref:proton-coupled amino acid transporter-like protein pathetic n=1 Tax=Anticarsia gemmatalis TaxID=129554 RepID=UPI003F769D4A
MSKEKDSVDIENFKSTADLTSNPGFQSSISIASKAIDEKPYNPFEHRTVEHPNSTIGSVVHLLKACLGTGILAMPGAFKNSGLAAGIVGTIIAGFVCTHTVAMVVRIAQDSCVKLKKPSLSFSETCGAAFTLGPKPLQQFGPKVKSIVDYSMTVTYFSVLCVYVVFIGSSLKEVLDFYYPEFMSIQAYCAITLVPLVLIGQIRNLKYLVPFSAIANVFILIVFSITMYYLFVDLPPVTDRVMVASVTTWPLFMSTAIFAMEGIGVVMPIENEMRNPKRFLGCPGVLNVSMIIAITLYGIVGFFGYLQYGDEAKGSVTLNLPEGDIIAQAAKLLMAVVIFLSYALQFYVPMEMITRTRKGKESKYENFVQVAIRTGLVTVSVAIAAAFPNLELVISFVGAVFFSTLGLLIPVVIDTVHRWEDGFGFCGYHMIKNIIIGLISLIALFSGAYVSIEGMIQDFGGSSHESHNATLT